MAGRRKFYRLYISGKLVAQGDADFLAGILGISPDTLQHYGYAKAKPSYITLEPLPILYIYKRSIMTIDELESSTGMKRGAIWNALGDGKAVRGHMVRRYEYEQFSMPADDIRAVVACRKSESRNNGRSM